MTLTSCSGERPPSKTATRVSFLLAILYPQSPQPVPSRCTRPQAQANNRPGAGDTITAPAALGRTHEARDRSRPRRRSRGVRHDGEFAGWAQPLLVWAHGWGHTHRNMLPLAEAMRRAAGSVLLDLPGFGASPPPPDAWGTADYADAVAEWLAGPTGRAPRLGGAFLRLPRRAAAGGASPGGWSTGCS